MRAAPRCLFIYPEFRSQSFWNYRATCELVGARYPATPLGLITVAALLPSSWEVRLVDCNVEKLDVKLYGPPLFNIEAGKSGATDKNLPVIGKGTTALCPIIPLAVPYKIDVAATKGAGRIGVQVYARNK